MGSGAEDGMESRPAHERALGSANSTKTSLDVFDFVLPKSLIAHTPLNPRDSAKLLHINKQVDHYHVYDLPSLLSPHDVLVINNTRVMPTRLRGKRGGASIEVTLHKKIAPLTWKAFAKPARKLSPGDTIIFSTRWEAEVLAKEEGEITLFFAKNKDEASFRAALYAHGAMPLPPYIDRKGGMRQEDKEDYQTLFARHEGAVAAPTAGLHFTPPLLQALKNKHIECYPVTLHVGAGTFLPVKAAFIEDHVMHKEWFTIPAETVEAITRAKQEGRRVVAVGTTSLRALESVVQQKGKLVPFKGETGIFITPGFTFQVVDALFTNFHLPCSTLFMLVCAFAGIGRMQEAYRYAIENQCRFFSYGDACLIEKPVKT